MQCQGTIFVLYSDSNYKIRQEKNISARIRNWLVAKDFLLKRFAYQRMMWFRENQPTTSPTSPTEGNIWKILYE
jgi:hypothetical protein